MLAALLALGFAAAAPQGASAAPIGPAPALQSEAAPATVEKAQYGYYRRRGYGPRFYGRRGFYGGPRFYGRGYGYGRRGFYGGGRRFYGGRRSFY